MIILLNMPSCRQVSRDCEFLEHERVMDYSMLVGLHFRETTPRGNVTPSGRNSGACTPSGFDDGGPRLSGVDVDHLIIDPSRYILNQLILAKLLKVS
jgi:1-phosphatidylinositol-4-phosphate 5-kinase